MIRREGTVKNSKNVVLMRITIFVYWLLADEFKQMIQT